MPLDGAQSKTEWAKATGALELPGRLTVQQGREQLKAAAKETKDAAVTQGITIVQTIAPKILSQLKAEGQQFDSNVAKHDDAPLKRSNASLKPQSQRAIGKVNKLTKEIASINISLMNASEDKDIGKINKLFKKMGEKVAELQRVSQEHEEVGELSDLTKAKDALEAQKGKIDDKIIEISNSVVQYVDSAKKNYAKRSRDEARQYIGYISDENNTRKKDFNAVSKERNRDIKNINFQVSKIGDMAKKALKLGVSLKKAPSLSDLRSMEKIEQQIKEKEIIQQIIADGKKLGDDAKKKLEQVDVNRQKGFNELPNSPYKSKVEAEWRVKRKIISDFQDKYQNALPTPKELLDARFMEEDHLDKLLEYDKGLQQVPTLEEATQLAEAMAYLDKLDKELKAVISDYKAVKQDLINCQPHLGQSPVKFKISSKTGFSANTVHDNFWNEFNKLKSEKESIDNVLDKAKSPSDFQKLRERSVRLKVLSDINAKNKEVLTPALRLAEEIHSKFVTRLQDLSKTEKQKDPNTLMRVKEQIRFLKKREDSINAAKKDPQVYAARLSGLAAMVSIGFSPSQNFDYYLQWNNKEKKFYSSMQTKIGEMEQAAQPDHFEIHSLSEDDMAKISSWEREKSRLVAQLHEGLDNAKNNTDSQGALDQYFQGLDILNQAIERGNQAIERGGAIQHFEEF